MQAHDRHGQGVYRALPILGQILQGEHRAAHQVEGLRQVPFASVVAALARDDGEQVPAPALADYRHRDQLRVATSGFGTGSPE